MRPGDLARLRIANREHVDEARQRGEYSSDNAAGHRIESDIAPEWQLGNSEHDVTDKRKHPEPNRKYDEHRMNRMFGDTRWSLHRVTQESGLGAPFTAPTFLTTFAGCAAALFAARTRFAAALLRARRGASPSLALASSAPLGAS